MILKQVLYELFDSDAKWLDDHPDSDFHEFDREIRLVFQYAGMDKFISWNQAGDRFQIKIAEASFFTSPSEAIRNLSDSRLWRDIVGQSVSIDYVDEDHLMVRITDGQHNTYCCSKEGDQWGVDVIHVTNVEPRLTSH